MNRPWQLPVAVVLLLISMGALARADDNGNDPFAVPSGGPDKQAAFLAQLGKQRPHDAESAAKMQSAAVKAADNILAGKANDAQLDLAVQVKASLCNDADELAALEGKLKKQGHAKQARTLHSRLLAVRLEKAAGDRGAFRKELEEVKSVRGQRAAQSRGTLDWRLPPAKSPSSRATTSWRPKPMRVWPSCWPPIRKPPERPKE